MTSTQHKMTNIPSQKTQNTEFCINTLMWMNETMWTNTFFFLSNAHSHTCTNNLTMNHPTQNMDGKNERWSMQLNGSWTWMTKRWEEDVSDTLQITYRFLLSHSLNLTATWLYHSCYNNGPSGCLAFNLPSTAPYVLSFFFFNDSSLLMFFKSNGANRPGWRWPHQFSQFICMCFGDDIDRKSVRMDACVDLYVFRFNIKWMGALASTPPPLQQRGGGWVCECRPLFHAAGNSYKWVTLATKRIKHTPCGSVTSRYCPLCTNGNFLYEGTFSLSKAWTCKWLYVRFFPRIAHACALTALCAWGRMEASATVQCYVYVFCSGKWAVMVWAERTSYFRQQSASKCLNAGSSEVNCFKATRLVGHCVAT